MYKKLKWISILTLSVVSTIVFSVGFLTSLKITSLPSSKTMSKENDKTSNQQNKPTESSNNSYNILVMGDSLAKGTGDEKGQGFANDFATLWKTKTNKNVQVNNIAVNGDVSSGLLQIIKNEETLKAIESSKMIFISIGGNEISRFQNSDASSISTSLKETEASYLENLKNIFKYIRNKNKNSIIVFIGLYNPFERSTTLDKIKLLNDWNSNTVQLISQDPNSLFIPTYDLFKYNLDKYLSADNFHPNSAGYEAISKRIFEALQNHAE